MSEKANVEAEGPVGDLLEESLEERGRFEGGAVLVGAGEDRQLAELGRLASTLGLEVLGEMEQQRRDNSGYLGRGKREELAGLVREVGAGLVLADDELSNSQARVLEGGAGVPVVDRTELIIEIFAEHAGDAASRLEVELAGLQYRLPRVKGRSGDGALSRLGGGGAGGGGARRGSGEQQLEYDRRVIRRRMERIRARLAEEEAARRVRGARLKGSGVPKVALVGYTNAGKTTILNALAGETRSAADRLFETLETTTRLVQGTPAGAEKHGHDRNGSSTKAPGENGANAHGVGESAADFVVTDTVGFIRKLPTQLVHSFASTLEAAVEADVLVVCADASSEDLGAEIKTVEETLARAFGGRARKSRKQDDVALGVERVRESALYCLNKADLLDGDRLRGLAREYPGAVVISAKQDVSPLAEAIRAEISSGGERAELMIPHADYADAARLYGLAEIHSSSSTSEGTRLDVTIPKNRARTYDKYRTTS